MLNFEIYKWACHGQLCLSTLTLDIWPGPLSTRSVMWCVWSQTQQGSIESRIPLRLSQGLFKEIRPLLSIEDELSSHSQLKLQQFPEIRIPESSAGPAGLWPSPQVPTSPEVWNGSPLTRWGGLELLHKHFPVMATACSRSGSSARRPSWTATRPPTSWKTWTQTRTTRSR